MPERGEHPSADWYCYGLTERRQTKSTSLPKSRSDGLSRYHPVRPSSENYFIGHLTADPNRPSSDLSQRSGRYQPVLGRPNAAIDLAAFVQVPFWQNQQATQPMFHFFFDKFSDCFQIGLSVEYEFIVKNQAFGRNQVFHRKTEVLL